MLLGNVCSKTAKIKKKYTKITTIIIIHLIISFTAARPPGGATQRPPGKTYRNVA